MANEAATATNGQGFDPPRLTQPSKVNLVLEAVRRGILHGELRPGEPLSLAELSAKFGISPGPLREALRRLEGEGLVELRPARTAVVAQIDAQDLRDIYRLRISIEGDLAALVARRYSDSQIAQLEVLLGKLDYPDGDLQALGEHHTAFHRALLEPAASAWDWRVLELLWTASGRYLMLLFEQIWDLDGADAMRRSHQPMVDAAAARSPRALRRAVVEHLESGLVILGDALDS